MVRLLRLSVFHHRATPSLGMSVVADRVSAGMLHLDHRGAVVGQDGGCRGPGEQGGDVDYADSFQGATHDRNLPVKLDSGPLPGG